MVARARDRGYGQICDYICFIFLNSYALVCVVVHLNVLSKTARHMLQIHFTNRKN